MKTTWTRFWCCILGNLVVTRIPILAAIRIGVSGWKIVALVVLHHWSAPSIRHVSSSAMSGLFSCCSNPFMTAFVVSARLTPTVIKNTAVRRAILGWFLFIRPLRFDMFLLSDVVFVNIRFVSVVTILYNLIYRLFCLKGMRMPLFILSVVLCARAS